MLCPIANRSLLITLKRGFLISVVFCFLIRFKVNSACSDDREIVCPCGQKRKTFVTLCDSGKDDLCEKLKLCETCSVGSHACSTCPPGHFGRYCENANIREWNNRSNSIDGATLLGKSRARKAVSCRDIPGPKLGSIKCWYSRNEKECTGRCLPGHSFQNREDEEIVLKCVRGQWTPMSSFPQCVSEGHCDLEMTGAGGYNCTTGSRGTYCDIRCSGRAWVNNRFFCYPGRGWEPPLPYCIRAKGVAPPRVDCKCQNGGTCNPQTETCRCLEHFEGRFCERHVHVSKARCPDPGRIANGERMNSELRTPARDGQFYEEGSSVVFSCRTGYALVGHSLLTCQSSGTWSSKLPSCQNIRVPTTTTTTEKPKAQIFCPDPGLIANGDRWTIEGRASSRGDIFEKGKSVVYSCRNGYALQGLSILTCLPSRQWSNVLPECKKMSGPFLPITTPEDDGDEIAYCEDPGKDPNSLRIEDPWIDAKKGNPINKEEFPQGFRLRYKCKKGYSLEGDSAIQCHVTGEWSAPIPTCVSGPGSASSDDGHEIAYCEDPGKDPNSVRIEDPWIDAKKGNPINKEEFPQGLRLRYKCKEGYSLEGDSAIQCHVTGEWSAPIPTCVSGPGSSGDLSYCRDPGEIENGKRVVIFPLNRRKIPEEPYAEYPEGVKIQYFCFEGFQLMGANVISCMNDGDWSDFQPDCVIYE